ncbi:zinc finger BED domain-containing protein 5 [Trichonephila clavata]|uniref:Zinc finger BED domain-containing protein 5 n=1 Tax=Trichonephila clavata TaxID=2740835 RepID=A0A8X6G0Z5_TRICU|nr:zinc finger BED domain-containing protein 5 [Trichonephila clavata]
MQRWCSYNVWKISKHPSTCETKISNMHLDTLHMRREALASKEMSPGLSIVLTTVVTVVNYIKMRPLKSRIFSRLCKDMGAVHSSLLFGKMVITCGKFLQCVYELRNEIAIFLKEENLPEAEKFRDGLFVMKLSYWSIYSRN